MSYDHLLRGNTDTPQTKVSAFSSSGWFDKHACGCTHAAAVWLPRGCTAEEELWLLREFVLDLCERAVFLSRRGTYSNVISFIAARHVGPDGPKWLVAAYEYANSFQSGDWEARVRNSWRLRAPGRAAVAVQGRPAVKTFLEQMRGQCLHLGSFKTGPDIGLPESNLPVQAAVPGPAHRQLVPIAFDMDPLGTSFFECGLVPRWVDRRVWVTDDLVGNAFGLAFYTFAPPGSVPCAEYFYFDANGALHCSAQPIRAWSGEINLRSELKRLLKPTAIVRGVRGTEGMTFSSPDAFCDALYNEEANFRGGGATLAISH
jgi:hypothetical protein